jgi:hypothetical protein
VQPTAQAWVRAQKESPAPEGRKKTQSNNMSAASLKFKISPISCGIPTLCKRRKGWATRHYAEINLELRRSGPPIPTNDLWISALCRQHSLPLLSRDRHFDLVNGTKRIGW